MPGLEQIKIAKLIGKSLRANREKQGHNLAILALKLQMSVVEIVAIEDGNIFSFEKSIEKFLESAHAYAHELGVSLEETYNTVKKIKSITAKEWNLEIPVFLRKKE
jgi:transcriptional regulator with XRE-family HTH domain